MNGPEYSPNEAMHTISVPISLDIDQRLNLLHELRSLSAELQENPFIEPEKSVTELKGIRLESPIKPNPAPHMSLKITSSDSAPPAASISITGDRTEGQEDRSFIHRPMFNIWEDWRPGLSEPHAFLSNSSLIATLEPRLPAGALESMMDTPATNGIEVAHLLASFLAKKARTRTHYLHYKAHNVPVGDGEFSRDTDYIIDVKNQRVAHNLFVAASFDLNDFGHLRKTYRYEAIDEHGSLKSTYGTLNVSGGANIPKGRLHAFGLRDPLRNDPALAIDLGVNDIRQAYSPAKRS